MDENVMGENERIRKLRHIMRLTLAQFGERLGVQASAISKIERGENRVSDQMRTSICREFGVNEEWLRGNSRLVFNTPHSEIAWRKVPSTSDPDKTDRVMIKNHDISFRKHADDISPLEESMIRAYLELPKNVREMIIQSLMTAVAAASRITEGEPDGERAGSDGECDSGKGKAP